MLNMHQNCSQPGNLRHASQTPKLGGEGDAPPHSLSPRRLRPLDRFVSSPTLQNKLLTTRIC